MRESRSETDKLRLQVYIAEYQAMMVRVNWFMSLQTTCWLALPTFLTFVAAVGKDIDPVLIQWGAATVVEMLIFLNLVSLDEVYKHLLYIETNLKPQLAGFSHMPLNSFFGWERYVRAKGKAGDPSVFDTAPPGVALVTFFIATSLTLSRTDSGKWPSYGDILGLALASGALILVGFVTVHARKSRRRLNEACT
jgi:hypothetical protein